MVYEISYHLRKLRGASQCDNSIKTKVSLENLFTNVIEPNFSKQDKNYDEAIRMLKVNLKYSDEIRDSGITVSYDSISKAMVLEAGTNNSITPLKCAFYLFIIAYKKIMVMLFVVFMVGNYFILKLYQSIQRKKQAEGFYREIYAALQDSTKLRVKD